MHRYPVVGAFQLTSNDGQYFRNSLCNDVMLTSKFDWQRILVSPITTLDYSGNESVMTISRSNLRLVCVHGEEINTYCNIEYNGLRITNSNVGSVASVRSILTNDAGDLELKLTSSAYTVPMNSLSNYANVLRLRNHVGDVLIAGKSRTPSLFIGSNEGFVGLNHAKPETWLHIQASNISPYGHMVVERTALGGYGGQMTLKNATPVQAMSNSVSLAFQLHSQRVPYELNGRDQAHAQISAWLDSNNMDHTSLRFGIGGVERMRLSADGYLGLGVTRPDTVLHLRSLLNDTANVYLGSNTSLGYMLSKMPDGNLNIQRGTITAAGGTVGACNNVMSFTTVGRVGVRETAPVADLHMYSQDDPERMNVYLGSNTSLGYLISKMPNGNLNFQRGTVGACNNVLSLTTIGRIGVSELSPVAELHMYSQSDPLRMDVYLGSNTSLGYMLSKTSGGNLNIQRGVVSACNNVMSFTTAGRVGMRQESPVTDLHMSSQDDTGRMEIYLGNNASTGYLIQKAVNGNLNFQRGVYGSVANVLSLATSGRVGIFQSAPVTDLHMSAQGGVDSMSIYLGTSVGYSMAKTTGGDLSFARGAFASSTEIMRLYSTANVAIAAMTNIGPTIVNQNTFQLQVQGTTNLTGATSIAGPVNLTFTGGDSLVSSGSLRSSQNWFVGGEFFVGPDNLPIRSTLVNSVIPTLQARETQYSTENGRAQNVQNVQIPQLNSALSQYNSARSSYDSAVASFNSTKGQLDGLLSQLNSILASKGF